MIVHVFQLERFKNIENYAFNFINLLEKNLCKQELKEHQYFFTYFENEPLKNSLKNRLAVLNLELKNIKFFNSHFKMMKMIKSSKHDDIFFHQLSSSRVILFLFLNRKMINKVSWVIWGGDLYGSIINKHSGKRWLFDNVIKKQVIKNLKRIIGFKEDFNVVKDKYKTKAKFRPSLYPVPSHIYGLKDFSVNISETKRILIAHSANKINNHEEILKKLLPYKDKNIEIICPLSYGDTDNVELVEKFGFNLFGNKFLPLKEFLEPKEFSNLLRNIDIAIFAIERQAAVGILATLISAGKKVYFKKNIVPFSFYEENKITLYDTNELNNKDYDEFIFMKNELKIQNIKNINQLYSDKNLIEIWKRIFKK